MVCTYLLAFLLAGSGQSNPPEQPPFVAQITEMLDRAASGHSPTSDEMMTVESEPGLTSGESATALLPLLKRALTHPDAAVRQYGLAMLVGIATLPTGNGSSDEKTSAKPPKADTPQGVTAHYQADVGKMLAPLIPILGARLTDEHMENRELAAVDLGGFAPNPPATAYAPLIGFLKRDDSVGAAGVAAVSDLLAFGPVSPETADEIIRYIRRTDQTAETRISLVGTIASKPNQNQKINQALAPFLDSDDPALRAHVILSLPLLDLSADAFTQLKARVEQIAAAGSNDNMEVVSAARAVAGCWTQVRMEKGCPGN